MDKEYYSFEEVLRELQIEESQLKRLVSEGEINAINSGQTVKFAKSEVNSIRNNKMGAGTIIMPGGNEHSEDVLLIDEVDSGPISAIEEVGSSLTLQAELAESSALDESSAFVNVEDSGPLLSMEDSRDDTDPILNMSNEIKKSKIKEMREDTEELVFEQSSSEDLLETGELLFDSVNQVMPKNKEEADLFTESEMGISDDYDDIDEASVKAAIDFVDSSDEEIVSTSTPKSNIHYSSVEMQKREKVRTMAGISVGLLTFAVMALFFFYPPDKQTSITKVAFYTVKNISSDREYNYQGDIAATRKSEIHANRKGSLSNLLPENTKVSKGDLIASIGNANEIEAYQKLKKRYKAAASTYKKYRKKGRLFKKYYKEYIKTPRNERKKLSKSTKSAASIYRKMIWYKQNKTKSKKSLKALQKKVALIKAPFNGLITDVRSKNGSNVATGDHICSISDVSKVTSKFRISKGDAQNWNKDQVIPVYVANSKYNAIITSVNEDKSTQPISVWLHLQIANKNADIIPGKKASLKYKKSGEVMAIPGNCVFSENDKKYIFLIHDENKVFRREVELGKKHNNNYVSVSNIFANDKIVTDNKLELIDNQDVVVIENK